MRNFFKSIELQRLPLSSSEIHRCEGTLSVKRRAKWDRRTREEREERPRTYQRGACVVSSARYRVRHTSAVGRGSRALWLSVFSSTCLHICMCAYLAYIVQQRFGTVEREGRRKHSIKRVSFHANDLTRIPCTNNWMR